MGGETYSRSAYTSAKRAYTSEGKRATFRGEQTVKETGKLDKLVDPAEFGVIRESRIRVHQREDGLWEVNVGAPVPNEYRLDTTGSMGDNVERALRVLPNICELTSQVLPDRDPHYCASIFGDVQDRFILCRGQFEMLADRMVNQLTLMHPEGAGGDATEDPQYGIFGAAYLTKAYIQLIGLKSYDFTITDAPARETFVLDYLKRVFGKEVLEKVKENGHQMSDRDLPSSKEAAQDLLKRAHRFALIVKGHSDTVSFWKSLYGKDYVISLPVIENVAHVMAAVIGLTEGTLDLQSVTDFLTSGNLTKTEAKKIVEAISHIPLNAQRVLPNYKKIPVKGDLFAEKTDLWPIAPDKVHAKAKHKPGKEKSTPDGGWL